jgi:putative SOS response-associated peptidase YedK
MCGRYASILTPELIAQVFGTLNPLPNLQPTWNMAPTKSAPVVIRHPETGLRHLVTLRWGLAPYFTKDLKRARLVAFSSLKMSTWLPSRPRTRCWTQDTPSSGTGFAERS